MAGKAKYTNYAPVQDNISVGGSTPPSMGKADYTLLKLLFGTRYDVIPFSNGESDLKPIMVRANALLTPHKADADPMWFPKGVFLDFQNPDPALQAPHIPSIDMSKAAPDGLGGLGGASTPYTPNLSSTDQSGAGSTDPVNAVVMSVTDFKTVLGADNGTAVPSITAINMFNGSQLPSNLIPGFRPGRTLAEK